jgi:hypothetical protein
MLPHRDRYDANAFRFATPGDAYSVRFFATLRMTTKPTTANGPAEAGRYRRKNLEQRFVGRREDRG